MLMLNQCFKTVSWEYILYELLFGRHCPRQYDVDVETNEVFDMYVTETNILFILVSSNEKKMDVDWQVILCHLSGPL